MVARVTPVTPVAATSATRIRVGVGVIVPVSETVTAQLAVDTTASAAIAHATYIAPVTSISYVDLVLTAALDTTGRYQYLQHAAVMLDGTRYSLAKSLADGVSTPDAMRYEFEKSAAGDNVELSDEFSKLLTFIRRFSDAAATADTVALVAAKALQDSSLLYDAQAKQFVKARADAVSMADAARRAVSKPAADTAGVGDAAAKSTGKLVTDAVETAEDVLLALAKLLVETVGAQDSAYRTVAKLISDGVGMNDAFDTGDGAVFSFSKGVSNVTIVGDATSKHPAKAVADSATTADSGVLTMQDYCEIDYFLTDYVGQSRVF